MKRALGYSFYFVAELIGGREDQYGPRPQVMFVLATLYAFMLVAFALAFSRYVFDVLGAYISLWPPAFGFRNPMNPRAHLGLAAFLCGLALAYIGYRFLVEANIRIPSRRQTFKDFVVFIAFCFWPAAIMVASIRFGGVIFQCSVHLVTLAFFAYRGRREFSAVP